MGLFPSNLSVEEGHRFPNLAGRVGSKAQATKELTEAGIYVHEAVTPGEVNCEVIGACGSWIFRRAWYYWEAVGPGIPSAAAKILHDEHGKEVRVKGHCGCPDPIEYCKGEPVTYYHIDTQRGLNALVETIWSVETYTEVDIHKWWKDAIDQNLRVFQETFYPKEKHDGA